MIALMPMDERPATGRHAAMIAAVAGVHVQLPPSSLLSRLRVPGDRDGLSRWLSRSDADAAVVSLDMLGFGGLVPSRLGYESIPDVLSLDPRVSRTVWRCW